MSHKIVLNVSPTLAPLTLSKKNVNLKATNEVKVKQKIKVINILE